jgi:translation elongation factor EF-1beta
MAQFNSIAFVASFDKVLETLSQSEKITKATLQTLSRDLLALLHTKNPKQGDIGYINRTINVLTPVNRKVFMAFCREFTGFIADKSGQSFLKKSQKHYDDAALKALEWLDDPMNNIWSWADRNIEIVPKEFTLDIVKKSTEQMLKKADKAGIDQADILGAMFEAGFTLKALLVMLEKQDKLEGLMEEVNEQFDIIEEGPQKGE